MDGWLVENKTVGTIDGRTVHRVVLCLSSSPLIPSFHFHIPNRGSRRLGTGLCSSFIVSPLHSRPGFRRLGFWPYSSIFSVVFSSIYR